MTSFLLLWFSQAAELDHADLRIVREHLVPLLTTQPSAADDDLAFLDEFVMGARVVALGEATHGASEFFKLKHRIVRYLVETHGFSVIALEANVPEARAVDEYLGGGRGDAAGALSGLFQVWNTREMLALVEWLKEHNSSSAERVEFHGFDIQSPGAAARAVLAFLERFDPAFHQSALDLYRPALLLERDWNPSAFARLAPALLRNGRLVLEHLRLGSDAYAAAAPESEFEWALRNALLVVQLGEHAYDNLTSRDRSMADNVLWLVERNADARIIVWAHNSHVMEAQDEGYAEETAMGAYLASALGDSYRSLGFVFAQGRNRAFDPMTKSPAEHELPLAPQTFGGRLHELGEPLFFLDLRGLEYMPGGAWLGAEQSFRSVGWAPLASQRRLAPSSAFDGLLFIDTVTPAREVHNR